MPLFHNKYLQSLTPSLTAVNTTRYFYFDFVPTAREGNVFRGVFQSVYRGQGTQSPLEADLSAGRPPPVLTSGGGHCNGGFLLECILVLHYFILIEDENELRYHHYSKNFISLISSDGYGTRAEHYTAAGDVTKNPRLTKSTNGPNLRNGCDL